jgi:tetratricopeptide (TPR) repeat protein
MKLFCFVAIFVSGMIGSARADAVNDFSTANREYAAGHFQAATEGYEALARSGKWNSTLFYNLGNSWYRRGDLARAILNYERTLALDSRHAEATANLRLVRDQARALELTPQWPERFFGSMNSNAYAWTAAFAFWVASFALAVLLFRRSTAAVITMIVAFLVSVCAIYVLYLVENGNRGKALAIVTGKNIEARLATADNANSVLALPAGSEIKILSTRGDWSYAALPNSLRGWIPTRSAESVRM